MEVKVSSSPSGDLGSFFFFSPKAILERLGPLFHFWRVPSFQARLQGWIASLRAFSHTPLAGYGWGTFSTVIPKFNPDPEFLEIRELYLGHAHSEPLELAVETGLLGVGSFLWLVVTFFKRGIKLFEKGNGWIRYLGLGLWAGGLAILLDNLGNLTLRTVPVALLFWIFLATTASLSTTKIRRWRLARGGKIGLLFGVLLLAAGFPFLLWGQINQVRSSRALFFGDLEVERGQPHRAIPNYQKAATLDRGNLLALYKLGYQYLKRGNFSSALECYQQIEEYSPFYPRLHFYMGLALMGEKRFKEAIPELEEARELEDNFDHNFLLAQLHEGEEEEAYWLGRALSRSGRTLRFIEERIEELEGIGAKKKANELFKRLKETKSRVSIAAQRLIFLAKGDIDRKPVLQSLKGALQDKPNEPFFHRYLGLALYQAGRFREAEAELEEALRNDPTDVEAMDGLALCYTLQGRRFDEALQLIRRAISDDPRPTFYLDLSYILYRRGELKRAEAAAKKALSAEEKERPYALLGLISISQGSEGRAREYMEKAIEEAVMDPSFQRKLREVWGSHNAKALKEGIEALLYP